MMEQRNLEVEKSPLRLLRENAGLTRPQVRERIGISERRQADWEAGKALPNAENLVALACLYGLSLKAICMALGLDVSKVPDDASPVNPNHEN